MLILVCHHLPLTTAWNFCFVVQVAHENTLCGDVEELVICSTVLDNALPAIDVLDLY